MAPVVSDLDASTRERQQLEEVWTTPPGVRGFFTAANHKHVGRRFLVTTMAFFLAGGLLALLMRVQLSRPEHAFVGPDLYNQLFTMHPVVLAQGVGSRETDDMSTSRTLDVSGLPTFAFGHRSILWWGTMGFIAIEGTVFAMAIVSYVYLRGRVTEWPPGGEAPGLTWGTLNLLILLASVVPNHWTKKQAEALNLEKTKLGLLVCLGIGLAFLVVRVLEFGSLNCRWDTNAYGSIVWVTLGLHTAHLLTDYIDTVILAAVMFVHPSPKRFVDVTENAIYWWFVVLSWIPLYALLYVGPRVL